MELHFYKLNPAGNTTILVTDPLPREVHGKTAGHLMQPQCLCADQVGFLENPSSARAAVRLQMAGGEFCGNAARAAAALLVKRRHPRIMPAAAPEKSAGTAPVSRWSVIMEVSGCEELLESVVEVPVQGNTYQVETTVPAPTRIVPVTFDFNGKPLEAALVELPGIIHLVLEQVPPSEDVFFALREQLKDIKTGALGVMFFDPDRAYLKPLVYVRETGQLIWEGSCGSGSVAAAAVFLGRQQRQRDTVAIRQPGGIISVELDAAKGKFFSAKIGGPVEFVAQGTVYCPGSQSPVNAPVGGQIG